MALEIALAIVDAVESADPALSAMIVHYSPRTARRRDGDPSHALSVSHEAGGRGEVTVTPAAGPYDIVACEGLPGAVAAIVWAAVRRLGSEQGHDRLLHAPGFYSPGVLRAC